MSRRATVPAWSLVGASMVVTAAAGWFAAANDHSQDVVGAVAYLALPVVGGVVAARHPRNPIGWLFLVNGLLTNLDTFTRNYAQRAVAEHRHWPLLHPIAWVDGWLWVPGIALLLVYALLLFPTGRPPSPRWRPVMGVSAVAIAGWVAAAGALAWPQPTAVLVADAVPNPAGAYRFVFAAGVVCVLVVLGCALLAAASLVRRLVTARGVERQQVKWVAAAGAVMVLVEAVTPVLPQVQALGESVGFALIAVAAGVAILRYRLYDIDRVISRTVSYLVVSGLLLGVYLGFVTLLTDVLPFRGDVGTAASVLVAVALFAPLRRRVQNVVDRRFNRARYDAAKTVAAFAAGLREQVDLGAVRDQLLGAVAATIAPTVASVWVRELRS